MNTKTTKKTPAHGVSIDPQLETERLRLEDEKKRLEAEQAELEAKIKVARGTARDLRPLEQRVEDLLKTEPCDVATAAHKLGAPAARVQAAIRALREGERVFNVGTEHAPRWQLVLGDSGPTPELIEVVGRLIRERPWTREELMKITGARAGRVSGAIVALQEDPANRVVNVGTHARARWFALPAGVKVSKLASRS